MKKTLFYLFLFIMVSCESTSNKIEIEWDNIDKIEVLKGYPGEIIELKDGFEKEFLVDLNNSIIIGPTKFGKTHKILIYHSNGKIDEILSNGTIHQFKNWFKTKENLIKKYSK